MSEADQFRHYAQEALLWARQSTTEQDKRALLELARTWSLAALESESPVVVSNSPPEHMAL
jgi:hypothetical protein